MPWLCLTKFVLGCSEELTEIVKSAMIHGPYGELNDKSPCLDRNGCTKRYPRTFCEETSVGEDSYPLYRWRDHDHRQCPLHQQRKKWPRGGHISSQHTTRDPKYPARTWSVERRSPEVPEGERVTSYPHWPPTTHGEAIAQLKCLTDCSFPIAYI